MNLQRYKFKLRLYGPPITEEEIEFVKASDVEVLLLQRAQEIAELKAELREVRALYEANHG